MVKTGEFNKDIAKSYIVTNQQYGFHISCKSTGDTHVMQNILSSSQLRESSQLSTTQEEETTESSDDEADIAHESQDLSHLSNSSNLTIIDDVNELLAESRQRRGERRLKREADETQNQMTATQEMPSDEESEEVTIDATNEDSGERPATARRFGNAIPSNISKLFHVRGEDNRNFVFSIQEVTCEERIINREMLESS